MRQFIWSLLLTISLVSLSAEVVTPIIQHPQVVYSLPVHKTLYIARNIPDAEMLLIIQAALEWSTVTHGEIVFDFVRMPTQDMNPATAIVMVNVTPDFPDIIISDNANRSSTLGLYTDKMGLNYIDLVAARLDEKNITEVVLHELGHALGLKHIEGVEGIGTLMYHDIDLGSNHITNADLDYLCALYHCDARKFHELP